MELINNIFANGAIGSLQGGRRENQDDCGFLDLPSGFLVVVCDGMGGGPAGKIASYIAKNSIAEYIRQELTPTADRCAIVNEAIQKANANIRAYVEKNPATKGMGTTAVVLLINEQSAVVGHVGDSRLYKIRGRQIINKTNDHSVVGDMVRNKVLTEEQARLSSQSNILTRSVGVSESVEVDVEELAYERGDRFALCTDGLWGACSESELVKHFAAKKSIPVIVETLMDDVDMKGKASGGNHDNLSLALFQITRDSKKKEKMGKQTKKILLGLATIALISIIANVVMLNKSSVIPEMQEEIKQLTDSLKKRDADINMYKGKLTNAEMRIHEKDEASSANSLVSEYKINDLKQQLDNAKKEIDKQKAENEKLKSENVELKKKPSKQQAARDDLKNILEQMAKMVPVKTSGSLSRFNDLKKAAVRTATPISANIAKQIQNINKDSKASKIREIKNKL